MCLLQKYINYIYIHFTINVHTVSHFVLWCDGTSCGVTSLQTQLNDFYYVN